MAVSALKGGRLPLFPHHHQCLPLRPSFVPFLSEKLHCCRANGFSVFARYSQAQDFSASRIQDSLENLPKLVEDIVQTSISTGPRGALRLAQGIQAFIGVGGEWLADISKIPSS